MQGRYPRRNKRFAKKVLFLFVFFAFTCIARHGRCSGGLSQKWREERKSKNPKKNVWTCFVNLKIDSFHTSNTWFIICCRAKDYVINNKDKCKVETQHEQHLQIIYQQNPPLSHPLTRFFFSKTWWISPHWSLIFLSVSNPVLHGVPFEVNTTKWRYTRGFSKEPQVGRGVEDGRWWIGLGGCLLVKGPAFQFDQMFSQHLSISWKESKIPRSQKHEVCQSRPATRLQYGSICRLWHSQIVQRNPLNIPTMIYFFAVSKLF